jgi:hypothetical protein
VLLAVTGGIEAGEGEGAQLHAGCLIELTIYCFNWWQKCY